MVVPATKRDAHIQRTGSSWKIRRYLYTLLASENMHLTI